MTRHQCHRLLLLLATWFAVSSPALAQSTPFSGSVANPDCTDVVDNLASGGEFIAVKLAVNNPASYNDFLLDLRAKGGQALRGTDAGGGVYLLLGGNFRYVEAGSDVVWVYFTHQRSGIALDSGQVSVSGGALDACTLQVLGNSLPVGRDAGIGLVLPGAAGTYDVDLDGAGPAAPTPFPFGFADAIQTAFAPLPDRNTALLNGACTAGGAAPDPRTMAGHVVGYNVYRVPALGAATAPPARDFMGSWQHFIPFSPLEANCGLTTCAGDIVGDIASFQALSGYRDNDGRPYSGDELILFHDGPTNGDGSPRASGTPPDPLAQPGYWYAFQPVIGQGPGQTLRSLDGVGLTNTLTPVVTLLDGPDGARVAADLDADGTADFYSPQATLGLGGLGLTNGSVPLLSPPVLGRPDRANTCALPPPTGTCCVGTTCTELTAAECMIQPGTYGGDGTTCAAAQCGLELRVNDEVQRLQGIPPGDAEPNCGLFTAPTLDSILATPCLSPRVGCQPTFRIRHVRVGDPTSLPLRVAPPAVLLLPGEALGGFEAGVLTFYELEGCDFQLFVTKSATGPPDLLLDLR